MPDPRTPDDRKPTWLDRLLGRTPDLETHEAAPQDTAPDAQPEQAKAHSYKEYPKQDPSLLHPPPAVTADAEQTQSPDKVAPAPQAASQPPPAQTPQWATLPDGPEQAAIATVVAATLPSGMAKDQMLAQGAAPVPLTQAQRDYAAHARAEAANAQRFTEAAVNAPPHPNVQLRDFIAADNLAMVAAEQAARRNPQAVAPLPVAENAPVPAPVAEAVPAAPALPAADAPASEALTLPQQWTPAAADVTGDRRPPPPELPPPPNEPRPTAPQHDGLVRDLAGRDTSTPSSQRFADLSHPVAPPAARPVNENAGHAAPDYPVDDRSTFQHLTDTRLDSITEDLAALRSNDNVTRPGPRVIVSTPAYETAAAIDAALDAAGRGLEANSNAFRSPDMQQLVKDILSRAREERQDVSPAMLAMIAAYDPNRPADATGQLHSAAHEKLVLDALARPPEEPAQYVSPAMQAVVAAYDAAEAQRSREGQAPAGAPDRSGADAANDAREMTDAALEHAQLRSAAHERLVAEGLRRNSETSERNASIARNTTERDGGGRGR